MDSPFKNSELDRSSRGHYLAKSDVLASNTVRKKMVLDLYNFDQELVHSQDPDQILTRLKPQNKSFYYETLPNINRFDPRDLQKYMQDFQRGSAFGNTIYSTIYDIAITSQDILNVVEGVSMSPFVMACFQRYLVNWLDIQNIKNVTTLVFVVNHYRKKYVNLQFEYVKPFRNKFKTNADSLLNNLLYLNLVFYYDHRWIIATYNTNFRRFVIFDFLAPKISKVTKDDIYSLVKQFMEDEFGISVDNYDYVASGVVNEPADCSFHVCSFMAKLVFENLPPEHVKYSYEDVLGLQKSIPWLIFKLRDKEPRKYHILRTIRPEVGPGSKPKPAKSMERPVLSPSHNPLQDFGIQEDRPKIVSPENNATNRLVDEIDNAISTKREAEKEKMKKFESEKITLQKSELELMFKHIREDVLKELKRPNSSVHYLNKIGAYKDEVEKEEFTREEMEKILEHYKQKVLKDQERDQRKKKKEEEYEIFKKQAVSYANYMKECNDFYNFLNYFYTFNPALYAKITGSLSRQAEDELLKKYKMLHMKYNFLQHDDQLYLHDIKESIRREGMLPRNKPFNINIEPGAQNDNNLRFLLVTPSRKYKQFEPEADELEEKPEYEWGKEYDVVKKSNRREVRVPREFMKSKQSYPQGADPIVATNKKGAGKGPTVLFGGTPVKVQQPLKVDEVKYSEHALKPKENQKDEALIASRYNIQITRKQLTDLREKGIADEKILNFFGQYLQEKIRFKYRDPKAHYVKHNLFFFDTEFYQILTQDNYHNTAVNYEGVASYTKEWFGRKNTILDVFKYIAVPIRLSDTYFVMVVIEPNEKRMSIYDTGARKEKITQTLPIYKTLVQYLQKEFAERAQRKKLFDKWIFDYAPILAHKEDKESGLILCKLLYNLSNDEVDEVIVTFGQLRVFREKMADFLLKIGITSNIHGELGPLSGFPL